MVLSEIKVGALYKQHQLSANKYAIALTHLISLFTEWPSYYQTKMYSQVHCKKWRTHGTLKKNTCRTHNIYVFKCNRYRTCSYCVLRLNTNVFCTCSKWEHVRTCSKSVTFEHLDVFCTNVFCMCSKWEHVRTCSKSVTFEHLMCSDVFCMNVFCMCSKWEHVRTCSKSVTFEHLAVFCTNVFCMCSKLEHIRTCSKS